MTVAVALRFNSCTAILIEKGIQMSLFAELLLGRNLMLFVNRIGDGP
jgi:hypothetical protein